MTIKDIVQIILSVPPYQLKDIEKAIKEQNKHITTISYTVYNSSSILVLYNEEDIVYTIITKNVYTIIVNNTTGESATINIQYEK